MKQIIFITTLLTLVIFGLVSPTYAQGPLNFEHTEQQLGIGVTNSATLADIDRDGNLDAFTTNDFQNRYWHNYDGDGDFFFRATNFGTTGGAASAVADIDGDGWLDFFVAQQRRTLNDAGQNEVWLTGRHNFNALQDSGQRLGNTDSRDVALADLNGDGFLDAFVANASFRALGQQPTSPGNTVWFSDGNGNFTDSGQRLGNGRSEAVALADVNGDGFIDAVIANGGNSNTANKLWLNDGAGNFSDSGQTLGFDWSKDVAVGDVNGDERVDIVIGNINSSNLLLWLNDGNGNFNSSQNLGRGEQIALGDLDGDSDLDLVVGKFGGNGVLVNDGQGNFSQSGLNLGTSTINDIALGDVDHDGDLDILLAGNTTNEMWLNQTPPVFEVKATVYLPIILN